MLPGTTTNRRSSSAHVLGEDTCVRGAIGGTRTAVSGPLLLAAGLARSGHATVAPLSSVGRLIFALVLDSSPVSWLGCGASPAVWIGFVGEGASEARRAVPPRAPRVVWHDLQHDAAYMSRTRRRAAKAMPRAVLIVL